MSERTTGGDAAGTGELLRAEDERLRLAAESAHFGTYEHDFITGVDFWSRETRVIAGLTDDEPVSLARVFELIHPDDRARVRNLLDASLDLLDLSRISLGKITLRRQRVPLQSVVQHALETSNPVIEQAGHELTISLPPEPIHVDADPTRLAQIFANLLNNAAKFTTPGGHVWLTVEVRDGDAVISVRDNGIGIPANLLPRIFDMFTQVNRSLEQSPSGLGIGLSLVKALVELHGGSIEAQSAGHQQGSSFVVRLPVTAAPTAEKTVDDAPPQSPVRHRILIADDNRDAALSLAMILELMGYDTQTAYDGLEALAVAATFRPDVILLDIGMPKLNGHETARKMREAPWGKDVVLVALTGWGLEEDRRRSQEVGFDFHLVKPVELAALERVLSGLGPTP